jgi:hypothetical protein
MEIPVRPELPTAAVVRGLCIDHDRRHGQLCTVLKPPHRTYLSGNICSNQPSHFCTNNSVCVLIHLYFIFH